ncbi:TPA_asm: DUF1627 domain-containing protein [Salmonella enterica subsp. houtenae serovar 45:g,z51:-]|uniref:DUF1627 domain-containing protein n=1 Tax=Salmonella enterica subsp. houtenae serovar 45:g,z51:- TaxID=1967611 RepID=A0A736R9P7_SALHO|nr:DUF1627 domain-containing protein [Salmonella enterica subsp. houtenae str. CFSAN000557]HAE7767970.1 DUF1627 domain-containing protein [Salmonella enterica subsp. houtenae serovar 45:g,z51:-]
MASNFVLDVLKAMKKASAREIAARMEIDLTDAIAMLNEQKELGAAEFRDGGWSLPGYREPKVACATAKVLPDNPVRAGKVAIPKVKKVTVDTLISAIAASGPLPVEELAQKHGMNVRDAAAVLNSAVSEGLLVRKKAEGKFLYSQPDERLPESSPESVVADEEPVPEPERTNAQLVEAIPAFTEGRPDDLIIPSPAEMARMIRKAKQYVRELEQIRTLSIAAQKRRKTLCRLTDLNREG